MKKIINNNIVINRATTRNIVLSFNPEHNEELELKRVEKLFIMLDEKFIGSQFNDGKDFMTKASVIFEDSIPEYKTKKKDNSKTRYKLVNPHACASIDNDLLEDTINYIYDNYDVNYIKDIVKPISEKKAPPIKAINIKLFSLILLLLLRAWFLS